MKKQKVTKSELSIMDGIIQGAFASDVWDDILDKNPEIRNTEAELKAAMADLPRDIHEKIYEAHTGVICAHTTVAMLYGLYVADAIRTVAANPPALSQHIIDRIARNRGVA